MGGNLNCSDERFCSVIFSLYSRNVVISGFSSSSFALIVRQTDPSRRQWLMEQEKASGSEQERYFHPFVFLRSDLEEMEEESLCES